MNSKIREINGSTSVVLDTLRIAAAIIVFISHGYLIWFRHHFNENGLLGISAHFAVIIFFVLSGYLIAHASSRTSNLYQYLVARFSRLCSVLIPALVITMIIQFILAKFNPEVLGVYVRGVSWPRYLMAATFTNEIWSYSAAPPVNGPLWSLSYEFWYYMIFGLWFYRKSGKIKLLLLIVVCLIAGPKILLLMPAWLAGNFAYRIEKPKINYSIAWILAVIAFLLAILNIMYFSFIPYVIGVKPFYMSNQFITDYISAFFMALAIWIIPLGNTLASRKNWIELYRVIADRTFPLYVLHYPLLIFCLSVFQHYGNNIAQMWESTPFIIIISFLLGYLFEDKRTLWIRFFRWQFSLFKKPMNN